MTKHFPEAKAHDHWNLVFTAVIAISTLCYMVVAAWTLYEIHSGSADTHALALAAKRQADKTEEIAKYAVSQTNAAEKNAAAAERFAANAGSINDRISDAVGKLQLQADQTSRSANTAAKQLELIDRPWISVAFTPDAALVFRNNQIQSSLRVHFKNVGHAVATDVFVSVKEFLTNDPFREVLPQQDRACDGAAIRKKGADTLGMTLFPNTEDNSLWIGVGIPMSEIMANLTDTHLTPDFHDKVFGPIYLVGCVDYQYAASPIHHQTRFAYQVGRALTNAPPDFLRVIKVGEDVPLGEVRIARYMFGGDRAY
jgi:hypothetical protein